MKKRTGPRRKATNQTILARLRKRLEQRRQLDNVRKQFANWLVREARLINQWP